MTSQQKGAFANYTFYMLPPILGAIGCYITIVLNLLAVSTIRKENELVRLADWIRK